MLRFIRPAVLWVPVLAFVFSACTLAQPKPQVVQSNAARDLSPRVADSDINELVSGNNQFAFGLYRESDSQADNLFYSPYSISIALAMVSAGAGGDTAAQMAQTLHFTLPPDRLHPAFNRLALELASRSKVEGLKPGEVFQLNVANSLWGQAGFVFERPFLDVLALNYGAGMRLVDYQKDAEAARKEINDWVSGSTNRRIQDLIPPGALDALTRLVLTNAVYFKGAWNSPFDANLTQSDTFHVPGGGTVPVEMMSQSTRLDAMLGDGYRAVEMPYAGGQLSMLVLLPDEGRLAEVEQRLSAGLVGETVAMMQEVEVDLQLPKFKMEWSAELSKGLKALGMTDAFDPARADFSGMDGARDLFLSLILQKAFVSVDENGTEAAAATAAVVEAMAMPGNPVEPFHFRADRPFLFLIRDNPTGTILFLGRVMNPAT